MKCDTNFGIEPQLLTQKNTHGIYIDLFIQIVLWLTMIDTFV